jgi:hypothetical protein
MDQGLVSFSNRDTAPPRRPYAAFVPRDKVEEVVLNLLAAITADGKDVGYPQVREWRGESWFHDLVAACAKSWACLDGIDLRQNAFHRPQAPKTSDGLPIYGRDRNVRWRLWPTAPLLRTDDRPDALPFCAIKDAHGNTPEPFRSRLLGFLGSAPDLFLNPKQAKAAADAAVAALGLDPTQRRAQEFPGMLAEAWQGLSAEMGTALAIPTAKKASELLLMPPVALSKPNVPIFGMPAACDFGVIFREGAYDPEATKRFQEAATAAIS